MISLQEKGSISAKQRVSGKEGKNFTVGRLKKKKAGRQRLMRAVIQVIFFISMPSAFVAGFSGVKYIFNQIGSGNVLEVNGFLITLIGLGIFTILFGRYFCGYVCAFGTLGDFVYWISGLVQTKLFKNRKQFSLPEACVPICQKIKYVIWALIVIFCTLGVYEKFSGTSPWDVFSRLTAGRLNLQGYTAGVVIFVVILAGMALQERFFCQFLCPMGAVFAVLPILPVSVLKRNEAGCRKGCSLCRKKCPVHLKPEEDSLLSGECIRCGRCAVSCPGENIHLAGRLNGNEIWLVIIQAVIFFIMGTVLGLCRFM